MDLIWATREAIYFWRAGWTGSISLIGNGKFAVWRSSLLHCHCPSAVFFALLFEPSGSKRVKVVSMSAPLIVSIPHRLGREEAVRRLKAGLSRAAASVPVLQIDEERWEGDRLIFRVRALGQTASGHLDVADDHARLEVTLPWLLQRFARAAQVAIANRGNLLLTKRS